MDTHLTTIGSTLEAIARLHASAPSSSRNVYRPFTCAVLNTYKLDVLDYIRDADQVESNLFWYPPLPAGSNGTSAEIEVVEDTISPGVAARLPEPKEFIPPTPLRKTALEAEAKGLVQFDARTLLKAAQRLLDNYHHAPRARKHIKALLKRQSELEKQIRQHESALTETEELVKKLADPEQGKQMAALLGSKSLPREGVDDEIRKLQDSIRNEKMEILAVEQTTEDLLEKRQKLLTQKARATSKPETKARTSIIAASQALSSRSGSVTSKASSPIKRSFIAPNQQKRTSTSEQLGKGSQTASAISNKERGDHIEASKDRDTDEGDGDLTVRHQPMTSQQATVVEEGAAQIPRQPESSDELERICENVWSLFGDNLRYVAVDREGADYMETLRVLQDLSIGGGNSGAVGDASMASSSSESQATAATSGSTGSASSNLDNAGPPSPTVAIAAHVLFALLTTPSPHVMNFDELKAKGESWWISQGRDALRKSALNPAATDFDDSSSSLSSQAVYSLIAKKLLRLQFRGTKRIISFPAHIG